MLGSFHINVVLELGTKFWDIEARVLTQHLSASEVCCSLVNFVFCFTVGMTGLHLLMKIQKVVILKSCHPCPQMKVERAHFKKDPLRGIRKIKYCV